MIRGVLFDVDDTLIDLHTAMADMFDELTADLLGELGPQIRQRARSVFAGDHGGRYPRYLAGELGFAEQRALRFIDAFEAVAVAAPEEDVIVEWNTVYERDIPARWAPFPDVPEALDRLTGAGLPIAAVTNNLAHLQRRKLEAAGLAEQVSLVIGIDEAPAPKPAPGMFLAGVQALGLAPHECAYIGDNPIADGQGAQDAGLWSVLVDRTGAQQASSGVTKVASCAAAVDFVLTLGSDVE